MRERRREHVHNAATHRKLTARGDHVHARVRRTDELLHKLVDRNEVTALEMNRR